MVYAFSVFSPQGFLLHYVKLCAVYVCVYVDSLTSVLLLW